MKCYVIFFVLLGCNVSMCNIPDIRPMRILFVVGYFPKPSETFIINQMNVLLERGHEVFIYSFHKGDDEYLFPEITPLLKRTFYKKFPHDLRPFDIIYCQFGTHGKRIIKVRDKYRLKSKVVTCFRGYDIGLHLKRRLRFYRELFRKGDLLLPVCRFFKQHMTRYMTRFWCKPYKIVVHPSAIDCQKFSFKERVLNPNEKVRIVTVGRLVEKKGIAYAIEAIAKVAQKYSCIEYTIVGDGPLRSRLEKLIKKLHAERYIRLRGWVSHDKVADILDKAHLFVLSSVRASDGNIEGIPNALKEAMARGIPVISTVHAGIPELVEHGVSGLLVPPGNVISLAKKIEYLITHPDLWKSMGRAGRKKVESSFEIQKTVDKLEALFNKLLSKGSTRRVTKESRR